jgi:hypothetical protein
MGFPTYQANPNMWIKHRFMKLTNNENMYFISQFAASALSFGADEIDAKQLVCIHMCMYIRMYICTYICICIYMYVYIHTQTNIHIYLYIYTILSICCFCFIFWC